MGNSVTAGLTAAEPALSVELETAGAWPWRPVQLVRALREEAEWGWSRGGRWGGINNNTDNG